MKSQDLGERFCGRLHGIVAPTLPSKASMEVEVGRARKVNDFDFDPRMPRQPFLNWANQQVASPSASPLSGRCAIDRCCADMMGHMRASDTARIPSPRFSRGEG